LNSACKHSILCHPNMTRLYSLLGTQHVQHVICSAPEHSKRVSKNSLCGDASGYSKRKLHMFTVLASVLCISCW
jgi:hypothetical protein